MSVPLRAPAAQPILSVLIVNFNSSGLLRHCLDALRRTSIADRLETIAVDNASTDFDLEALTKSYPEVRWLPQLTNTTCTGGNNIAFAQSTGELVLMLNPDTRVEPEALERAVRHLSDAPELAAVGAYLIGPDGQLQRYYRRLPTFEDLPVLLFEPLFRGSRRGRRYLMLDETFEGETAVLQPPGAFLMFRRGAAGARMLDPGYFNFVSDLELCERLNRAGRVAVFDDVRCHHLGGGAGVGTTDPAARLRLYHDYTWGLRRYFSSRIGPVRRGLFNGMLLLYWVSRVGRLALRDPRLLGRALAAGGAALAGKPPRY